MEKKTIQPRRRGFMEWMGVGILWLWVVAIVGAISSFLRKPEARRSVTSGQVSAGEAASLVPGSARLVRHGANPFFVTRLDGGDILAVSALCSHFRCVLNWDAESGVLVCPCHEGRFNPTGDVLSGLPRQALPTYPVEIRRGEIFVRL